MASIIHIPSNTHRQKEAIYGLINKAIYYNTIQYNVKGT